MPQYDVINAVTLCSYETDGIKIKTTPLGIRLAGRQLVMTTANYEKYKEAMGIKSKSWIGFEKGAGEIDLPAELVPKHPPVSAQKNSGMPLDEVWIMTPSGTNDTAVRKFLKEKAGLTLT